MVYDDLIFTRWPQWVRLALFAGLHTGLAWLGRLLSHSAQASPVWFPSGLVLFALLVTRRRRWLAVALATIAAGLLTQHDSRTIWVTVLVSACGALEGILCALLLRRVVGRRLELYRVRDVIALMTVASGLSALSSLLSVALITLFEASSWTLYWHTWEVFWIGDALGMLVLTPLLLTWLRRSREWVLPHRWELGALLPVLILATHFVLSSELSAQWTFHPLLYLAFPVILGAALRFEAHGTTATTLIFSAVALWYTEQGVGPFIHRVPQAAAILGGSFSPFHEPDGPSLFMLQCFLAAASISGLLLAAALGERRRAEHKVSTLNQELRQSLEALAQTQSELVARERMAALGELAATMAHEVRNPLGAIANCVVALRHLPGPRLNTQQESVLEIIAEEVQRLDELVRGLLDFARPVEPQLRPEPLEPMVEGALSAALRAQSTGSRVTVLRKVAPDLPLALVDVQLLHVALFNLFTNALQAMPQGGVLSVGIERASRAGASCLQVSISDTGTGMSPEVQQRIFEPFFTTRATGAGLGLPIVRRIVEGHSGEVEVSSTQGHGTTFTVRLPCAESLSEYPASG